MAHMSQLLARLKRDPVADLPIADQVNQLLREQKVVWRERLLSPLVTLRLFLIQIAHGNCAIAALRQMAGINFAVSSYCEARVRLPIQLLESLLRWIGEMGQAAAAAETRLRQRIVIADGSSHSVEDTPELAAHFNLTPGTRPGVGYPMGKLMGLLDFASGMFLSLLALPLFDHDMRSAVMLHPMLAPGDILLGDRALCSFAHLALLQQRGVFACMHLHQRRKENASCTTRWFKPASIPAWMDAAQFAELASFLDVRIVLYSVAEKGFRTRQVCVATTLMNQTIWPDARIARLYGYRWSIETCFNHLKTTMNMNALRCKTLEGVMKELAMYLIVYNLIRLQMLKAATAQNVQASRVSFIDAMRYLAARWIGLQAVDDLIVNPDRKGRCQLRVIRRRLKQYDLLVVPRREKEAQIASKSVEIA